MSVVTTSGQDDSSSWSPDGRRIVFDSDRGEDYDVYVVSSRGGPATRLTRTETDEEWPDWSPDGRLIAFSSGDLDDLGAKIYVMRENGTARTLVPLPVPAVNPDWQPVP